MSYTLIPLTLLTPLLGIALWHDAVARRIPNWLVLTGLIAGLACNTFLPRGEGLFLPATGGIGFVSSLLGALAGLAIMFPLFALRAMGAGDAKLMAALGAFLGPSQILGAALLTFAAGGVLSLGAALCSRSLPRVFNNLRLMTLFVVAGRQSGLALSDVATTGRLPYAIAIACGTALQLVLAARGGWPFV